ncbi:unnamed protein product [Tetraodon nigroviridis]|uniref:(spotted green pufferfish) hypothetical protein n=1 Tax=Tetraodon nigroviridis TaxID=99883 RepID=Q4T422_TETNG|nr:unnamed protein product [Tetraodon nigroviridis]
MAVGWSPVAPLWINFHLDGTALRTSCHGNKPGGQQARHRGGPADPERTHHPGGRARAEGGDARFEAGVRLWC